jgi:hypothetical protein
MRIAFDVNVKAVLAVLAIGALSVGSFMAGERHQARKVSHSMPSVGHVLVIPSDITTESWCKSHPFSNWKLADTKNLDEIVARATENASDSGSCDMSGEVWEDVKPTK